MDDLFKLSIEEFLKIKPKDCCNPLNVERLQLQMMRAARQLEDYLEENKGESSNSCGHD